VAKRHEGLHTLEAMWAANIDDWAWVVHDSRGAGDRVVALAERTGRIKGSGVAISRRVGLVCRRSTTACWVQLQLHKVEALQLGEWRLRARGEKKPDGGGLGRSPSDRRPPQQR
jgi:hypothetical protein